MAAQKPQAGLGQKTISPPVQKRRDIQFAEKDEALRQDVHALGIMIGELLIEQGGASLYNSVETARQLAIAAREGETDAVEKLDSLVQKLSSAEARDFLKAFSAYFQGRKAE